MNNDTHEATLRVETSTKFAMVPKWIVTHPKLSHGAVRLYCALMSYASNSDKTAFPGKDRLASDMHVSVRSIYNYLKELEEHGAVAVERRRNMDTGNYYANRYSLIFDDPGQTPRSEPSATDCRRPSEAGCRITRPNLTTPTFVTPSVTDDSDGIIRQTNTSPSGRSIEETYGITTEAKRGLIDDIIYSYRVGEDFDNAGWIASRIEEETGIDVMDAMEERGWYYRIFEIVGRDDKGLRYGAATWLKGLLNWVRAN